MVYKEIAPGVVCLPIGFVNTYLVGRQGQPWVLVDCGLPGCAKFIIAATTELFGAVAPQAIVLTHGHIDHVGAAEQLSQHWGTPIYAHALELPYINGKSGYPPPDPTVGGFMAQLSRFTPAGGKAIKADIRLLPPDGLVPGLPDWRCIFTPGHSPGHISLFRESDRTLLAGDALATMDTDSIVSVITGKTEFGRAGSPFNCDWQATAQSVRELAELRPLCVGAGHGKPMNGEAIAAQLEEFASHYPMPPYGRHVDEPAQTDENGIIWLPPAPPDPVPKLAAALAVGAIATAIIQRRR